ncbi:hypothetical protein [Bdellovibrio svalbardensis]|uniref:Uncharacterized protein n=1 Tax=Bdellovibrio svalbardensis TaxID=2972972 RepID=A0ABT6DN30_9BACT|nr:hypothetical protein [Bdellovibrio svalbardensis]MDG0818046.1 hypothetical protein [Bdellovibrio svalbardensis]
MIRIFLVMLVLSFTGFAAIAADEVLAGSQYDEAKEAEIAKAAKKREYPGGRDEGDLKVQSQISTPARKLAPQAEVKNEEPAEE